MSLNKTTQQIARKKLISDILSAEFIKKNDWEPNHLLINKEKIFRINIKGIVVGKIEKPRVIEYIIDDGSGSMLFREFLNEITNIETYQKKTLNVGDVVNVIGKIREFNNERYINIEAIKKVSPKWLTFHKKELEIFGQKINIPPKQTQPQETKKEKTAIEIAEEDLNYDIVDFINNNDQGGGVFIEDILSNYEQFGRETIEKIIEYLLKNGYIFEYRKNYFKVL